MATEHVGCFYGPDSEPEHCHLCSSHHDRLIIADHCRMQRMTASLQLPSEHSDDTDQGEDP